MSFLNPEIILKSWLSVTSSQSHVCPANLQNIFITFPDSQEICHGYPSFDFMNTEQPMATRGN